MRWRSDTRRRTQKGRPSGRPSAGLVGEEGLEPSLPFGKRFFPTTTAFAAGSKGAVRGPDHLFAHGITRCGRAPSGLYTFLRQDRRLGSGLACRLRRQPPPNLRRSTPGVSPGALNMVGMRPSRLPVPPLARMRLSTRVPPRSAPGAEPMIAQDRAERGVRGRTPRSRSGSCRGATRGWPPVGGPPVRRPVRVPLRRRRPP
jgi:hypothetical protein